MKLVDLDTNREYAPVYIDRNDNLVIETTLALKRINSVMVMHPDGIGSYFKKLLSTKGGKNEHNE